MNILSVYKLQVGRMYKEQDIFWNELFKHSRLHTGQSKSNKTAGDFNGHIVAERFGNDVVREGYSSRLRNTEGKRLLEYAQRILEDAVATNMMTGKSMFKMGKKQLITYKSDGVTSTIG